jgi:hypothetical protein
MSLLIRTACSCFDCVDSALPVCNQRILETLIESTPPSSVDVSILSKPLRVFVIKRSELIKYSSLSLSEMASDRKS